MGIPRTISTAPFHYCCSFLHSPVTLFKSRAGNQRKKINKWKAKRTKWLIKGNERMNENECMFKICTSMLFVLGLCLLGSSRMEKCQHEELKGQLMRRKVYNTCKICAIQFCFATCSMWNLLGDNTGSCGGVHRPQVWGVRAQPTLQLHLKLRPYH